MSSSTRRFPVSREPLSYTNISQSNPSVAAAASSPSPNVELVSNTGEKPTTISIPSFANWFKTTEIHDIEKSALPEFFDGKSSSKTPEIYKEYRDFMIHAYQQNPQQYLTTTACRRNLAGDVCSIMRVHSFLEHWGLINFQVSPDVYSPLFPHTSSAAAHTILSPNVSSDVLVQTLFNLEETTKKQQHTSNSIGTADFVSHKNAFLTSATPPVQIKCGICGGLCGLIYYVCEKKTDFFLCSNCFNIGRYPESYCSQDFFRTDSGLEPDAVAWTDQETLLLLEAIERYGDNWDAISNHVATKTKEQCILHFIRLPIEDPYLEDQLMETLKVKPESNGFDDSPTHILEQTRKNSFLPFSESANPLMAMIAFITASVSPSVAAAAAKSALESFMKQKVPE